MACRMRMTVGCVEQDDWSCHGPRAGLCGWRSRASEGERGAVETVAEACRDLERAGGRLALTGRLAALLARTPAELLPTACYLCQGLIAPEFAGVGLGLAEKLAVRAVATATGAGPEQVAASVREAGDLGLAAEQMLPVTGPRRGGCGWVSARPPSWTRSRRCTPWPAVQTAVSSCTSPRRVFRGSSRPHRVGSAARRDRCAGDGIYHRRAAAEGAGNRLRLGLRLGGRGGFGGGGPDFGEPAPRG